MYVNFLEVFCHEISMAVRTRTVINSFNGLRLWLWQNYLFHCLSLSFVATTLCSLFSDHEFTIDWLSRMFFRASSYSGDRERVGRKKLVHDSGISPAQVKAGFEKVGMSSHSMNKKLNFSISSVVGKLIVDFLSP